MLGTLIALLVLLTATAVVGVVVPTLFWVTLVALGGILLTGAVALCIGGARAEDDDAPERAAYGARAAGAASLRVLRSRTVPRAGTAQPGAEVRRAA